MCGRYALFGPTSRRNPIQDELELGGAVLDFRRNLDASPTQEMPIYRLRADGVGELVLARWGLVPSWANDPKEVRSTFNARIETVATKPTFRAAYKSRRCLVPMDGYYEWRDEGGPR